MNLITLLIIHTYTYLHLLQYHFLNKRPICFKAHLILTEDDNGTLFILSSLCCSLDIITIQRKVSMGNTKNEYIELQIIQIHLSPSKQKPWWLILQIFWYGDCHLQNYWNNRQNSNRCPFLWKNKFIILNNIWNTKTYIYISFEMLDQNALEDSSDMYT